MIGRTSTAPPKGMLGNATGPGDRLVEVGRLDEIIAAELLLRLGERAVDDQRPPLAPAHGRRGRRRLKRVAGAVLAGLLQVGGVLEPGFHTRRLFLRRHGRRRGRRRLLVPVDQQHVSHRRPPNGVLQTRPVRGSHTDDERAPPISTARTRQIGNLVIDESSRPLAIARTRLRTGMDDSCVGCEAVIPGVAG
jgi:hypothetical protein